MRNFLEMKFLIFAYHCIRDNKLRLYSEDLCKLKVNEVNSTDNKTQLLKYNKEEVVKVKPMSKA